MLFKCRDLTIHKVSEIINIKKNKGIDADALTMIVSGNISKNIFHSKEQKVF